MEGKVRESKIMLIIVLFFIGWSSSACPVDVYGVVSKDTVSENASNKGRAPLVAQVLNYTENPIDVPNPDRGFYRPSRYIVPVESIEEMPSIPKLGTTIAGTTVFVDSRIVYMKFDLRNFSSNGYSVRTKGFFLKYL